MLRDILESLRLPMWHPSKKLPRPLRYFFMLARYRHLHRRLILPSIRADYTRFLQITKFNSQTSDIPLELQPDNFKRWAMTHGKFRTDWFTPNIPPIYRAIIGRQINRVLEIGSYEGMSTVWFAKALPNNCIVTCVDTFEGSIEHRNWEKNSIEKTFDSNVKCLVEEKNRIRKLVGTSHEIVSGLIENGQMYDLIYIDGSHVTLDVVVDACLGWKVLRPGGIMIFDDCRWIWTNSEKHCPVFGVNAFINLVRGEYSVLWSRAQIILEKI